jgi:radical SAM protein with 4Fe4S-binding SPASM domain
MVNRFTFIQPHSFAGAYKASSKKNKRHYSPCAFLWYSMSISWDGTVVPCCIDVYKKYPLGNVHEHSLEALWNSENLVKLRKQICQGGYAEIELCSDCDVLWKSRFMGIPTKSLYNFIELITHRL